MYKERNDYLAVMEFTRAMGSPVNVAPTMELLQLRKRLLMDEVREYIFEINKAISELKEKGSVSKETMIAMTAENADVRYILAGDSVTFGLPTDLAFNRIHAANMLKLGPDGKPIRNEWGKLAKPEGWKPAKLDDLFDGGLHG